MRLRYTLPALAELDAVLQYVAAHSPQGARRIHARIELVTNLLLDFPRMGQRTEEPAIRRINTSPYPYLIFYEIDDDGIIIHAVRHGARDPSGMPPPSR